VAIVVASFTRQLRLKQEFARDRRQRPEIPHRGRGAHIRFRMPLLCMDEVRKLVGIPDKEDRRVVTHQIPIAFIRVELQRETSHVALRRAIRRQTGDKTNPFSVIVLVKLTKQLR
jgi:hypothetical protein